MHSITGTTGTTGDYKCQTCGIRFRTVAQCLDHAIKPIEENLHAVQHDVTEVGPDKPDQPPAAA